MTKPITPERDLAAEVKQLLVIFNREQEWRIKAESDRDRLAADVQRLTEENARTSDRDDIKADLARSLDREATLREERDGWASLAAADTDTMRVLIKERDQWKERYFTAQREQGSAALDAERAAGRMPL